MRIIIAILVLLSINGCSFQKNANQDSSPPNIVFIFTDDQTYTALAALGNDEIQTPNLDKLVHNGTTFTNAYNMGAWGGAVCAASRAMLISGQSVWRANQFRKKWQVGDSLALQQTWGKLMEKQGYDTYMTGKWHVNAPARKVFQNVTHVRPGMPKDQWRLSNMGKRFKEKVDTKQFKAADIMPIGYFRPKNSEDNSWSPSDTSLSGFWEGGKHWSEVLKDDAIDFIHQAKESENPFFMYLAFNAPHDPRQSPQEFIDKYPLENISLPKSWLAEYPYFNDMTQGLKLRDEALAPYPRTEFATKKHLQEYYALITHLDEQIGKILSELEQSGKMDNTIVFFTADHGLAMGKHGLMGKQNMYDHSIRVPLVIMGKGIPTDKKITADVYLQDVMATSLEMAGIPKPDYLEFNSFLDLMNGRRSKSHYSSIYGAYTKLQRMIRKDGFKLIVYPKIQKVLLFDLETDPEEMHDLAVNKKYSSKVITLFEELIDKQKELDDVLDLEPTLGRFKGE